MGYSDEVAIIGMAGRFPGAKNVNEFWKNLCAGVESVHFFNDEELRSHNIGDELLQHPNYVKAKAILDDIDLFDAGFFGINPREAEVIDPQHRLFLECAWEALEDAGYDPNKYDGQIGVYAGSSMSTYLLNILQAGLSDRFNYFDLLIGNDKDHLPTRVCYKLNLRGPSVSIQTACSTSLVAVHLACQSLLNGESDIVLAGGATIMLPQNAGYIYQEGGIFPPDGHCRTFDAQSVGPVSGNGLGIVVLKRLDDALDDCDCIHAVIKGSAINNDGSLKLGYTAPSANGQAQVISEALAISSVNADTIGYVEAHGTGTKLGDPIEISALTAAFRASTERKGYCAVGSVKTNIGHLDVASGVTGLIKVALALKHKLLPPSLNFKEPNPRIDFVNSPFYVNTCLKPWDANGTPRRASTSAFGFGGTNAHVILEEAPIVESSGASRPWQLMVVSAKTQSALAAATRNLTDYLKDSPNAGMADIAYTLQVGRQAFDYRRFFVCQTVEESLDILQTDHSRLFSSRRVSSENLSVAFMFPGQGTQYTNMAKEIYHNEVVFQKAVDQCCDYLQPHLNEDLRHLIYPHDAQEQAARRKLKQTSIAQPALFVIEYALAQLWSSWGVSPEVMIGHSIGEYVAACIAGVFSLEDALALVAARGKLMQQQAPGGMMAVYAPATHVMRMESFRTSSLVIAAVNAPNLCVVSGLLADIDPLQQDLKDQGIESRHLHTSHAFHSPMMEAAIPPLLEKLNKIELQAPKIPFISNVTGTWITDSEATSPQYWAQHLQQGVQFSAGIQKLLEEPQRVLLEVGPGKTLSILARQHVDQPGWKQITSLRHPKETHSDVAFLLKTLGQLWSVGIEIDWVGFYANERRFRQRLPTYPFERQRYWIDFESKSSSGTQNIQATEFDTESSPTMYVRPALENDYVAPRNATEHKVATVWQELLGIEQVGIHDDFFDLGGHSLLVTQFITRADTEGWQITTQSVFDNPTVAGLAKLIDTGGAIATDQLSLSGEMSPLDSSNGAIPQSSGPSIVAYEDPIELQVTQILTSLLSKDSIESTENVFEIGCNVELAEEFIIQVNSQMNRRLTVDLLKQNPTIQEFANVLRKKLVNRNQSPLVELQPGSHNNPLFLIHAATGDAYFYKYLARHLGAEQPVYGLRNISEAEGVSLPLKPLKFMDYTPVEEIAEFYIEEIQTIQPDGPYLLGGLSIGGIIAFEMAQQLRQQGHEVDLLALIDSELSHCHSIEEDVTKIILGSLPYFANHHRMRIDISSLSYEDIRQFSNLDEQWDYVMSKVGFTSDQSFVNRRLYKTIVSNLVDIWHYMPSIYSGDVVFFYAQDEDESNEFINQEFPKSFSGWEKHCSNLIELIEVPGDHNSMLFEPHVRTLAQQLKRYLNSVNG
ncbi:MAG: beta-ketoacyl synthase N-terminal-like domain-containing protein [Cyanobacteria bacterium P01_F01_bin.150]